MLDHAFTVGMDYYFDNDKNVKHGFRVAYSRSGEQITTFKRKSDGSTFDVPCRISTIYAMFGGRANYDISEKFSLNGKLFVGIAKANHGFGLDFNGYTVDLADKDDGYSLAADASVGVQYLFTKKFGLGLDLGYRPLPIDLSGFTAKLGLNFKI
ncbi:hypothetical protein AGMMS49921_02830 [Endomicrobiia bacterium]|nr:hypothetical protein AGMMS49921_02830 [Endomicrobiia bacterium]